MGFFSFSRYILLGREQEWSNKVVYTIDHKKAHLTVLGVHRGEGASTVYLQARR